MNFFPVVFRCERYELTNYHASSPPATRSVVYTPSVLPTPGTSNVIRRSTTIVPTPNLDPSTQDRLQRDQPSEDRERLPRDLPRDRRRQQPPDLRSQQPPDRRSQQSSDRRGQPPRDRRSQAQSDPRSQAQSDSRSQPQPDPRSQAQPDPRSEEDTSDHDLGTTPLLEDSPRDENELEMRVAAIRHRAALAVVQDGVEAAQGYRMVLHCPHITLDSSRPPWRGEFSDYMRLIGEWLTELGLLCLLALAYAVHWLFPQLIAWSLFEIAQRLVLLEPEVAYTQHGLKIRIGARGVIWDVQRNGFVIREPYMIVGDQPTVSGSAQIIVTIIKPPGRNHYWGCSVLCSQDFEFVMDALYLRQVLIPMHPEKEGPKSVILQTLQTGVQVLAQRHLDLISRIDVNFSRFKFSLKDKRIDGPKFEVDLKEANLVLSPDLTELALSVKRSAIFEVTEDKENYLKIQFEPDGSPPARVHIKPQSVHVHLGLFSIQTGKASSFERSLQRPLPTHHSTFYRGGPSNVSDSLWVALRDILEACIAESKSKPPPSQPHRTDIQVSVSRFEVKLNIDEKGQKYKEKLLTCFFVEGFRCAASSHPDPQLSLVHCAFKNLETSKVAGWFPALSIGQSKVDYNGVLMQTQTAQRRPKPTKQRASSSGDSSSSSDDQESRNVPVALQLDIGPVETELSLSLVASYIAWQIRLKREEQESEMYMTTSSSDESVYFSPPGSISFSPRVNTSPRMQSALSQRPAYTPPEIKEARSSTEPIYERIRFWLDAIVSRPPFPEERQDQKLDVVGIVRFKNCSLNLYDRSHGDVWIERIAVCQGPKLDLGNTFVRVKRLKIIGGQTDQTLSVDTTVKLIDVDVPLLLDVTKLMTSVWSEYKSQSPLASPGIVSEPKPIAGADLKIYFSFSLNKFILGLSDAHCSERQRRLHPMRIEADKVTLQGLTNPRTDRMATSPLDILTYAELKVNSAKTMVTSGSIFDVDIVQPLSVRVNSLEDDVWQIKLRVEGSFRFSFVEAALLKMIKNQATSPLTHATSFDDLPCMCIRGHRLSTVMKMKRIEDIKFDITFIEIRSTGGLKVRLPSVMFLISLMDPTTFTRTATEWSTAVDKLSGEATTKLQIEDTIRYTVKPPSPPPIIQLSPTLFSASLDVLKPAQFELPDELGNLQEIGLFLNSANVGVRMQNQLKDVSGHVKVRLLQLTTMVKRHPTDPMTTPHSATVISVNEGSVGFHGNAEVHMNAAIELEDIHFLIPPLPATLEIIMSRGTPLPVAMTREAQSSSLTWTFSGSVRAMSVCFLASPTPHPMSTFVGLFLKVASISVEPDVSVQVANVECLMGDFETSEEGLRAPTDEEWAAKFSCREGSVLWRTTPLGRGYGWKLSPLLESPVTVSVKQSNDIWTARFHTDKVAVLLCEDDLELVHVLVQDLNRATDQIHQLVRQLQQGKEETTSPPQKIKFDEVIISVTVLDKTGLHMVCEMEVKLKSAKLLISSPTTLNGDVRIDEIKFYVGDQTGSIEIGHIKGISVDFQAQDSDREVKCSVTRVFAQITDPAKLASARDLFKGPRAYQLFVTYSRETFMGTIAEKDVEVNFFAGRIPLRDARSVRKCLFGKLGPPQYAWLRAPPVGSLLDNPAPEALLPRQELRSRCPPHTILFRTPSPDLFEFHYHSILRNKTDSIVSVQLGSGSTVQMMELTPGDARAIPTHVPTQVSIFGHTKQYQRIDQIAPDSEPVPFTFVTNGREERLVVRCFKHPNSDLIVQPESRTVRMFRVESRVKLRNRLPWRVVLRGGDQVLHVAHPGDMLRTTMVSTKGTKIRVGSSPWIDLEGHPVAEAVNDHGAICSYLIEEKCDDRVQEWWVLTAFCVFKNRAAIPLKLTLLQGPTLNPVETIAIPKFGDEGSVETAEPARFSALQFSALIVESEGTGKQVVHMERLVPDATREICLGESTRIRVLYRAATKRQCQTLIFVSRLVIWSKLAEPINVILDEDSDETLTIPPGESTKCSRVSSIIKVGLVNKPLRAIDVRLLPCRVTLKDRKGEAVVDNLYGKRYMVSVPTGAIEVELEAGMSDKLVISAPRLSTLSQWILESPNPNVNRLIVVSHLPVPLFVLWEGSGIDEVELIKGFTLFPGHPSNSTRLRLLVSTDHLALHDSQYQAFGDPIVLQNVGDFYLGNKEVVPSNRDLTIQVVDPLAAPAVQFAFRQPSLLSRLKSFEEGQRQPLLLTVSLTVHRLGPDSTRLEVTGSLSTKERKQGRWQMVQRSISETFLAPLIRHVSSSTSPQPLRPSATTLKLRLTKLEVEIGVPDLVPEIVEIASVHFATDIHILDAGKPTDVSIDLGNTSLTLLESSTSTRTLVSIQGPSGKLSRAFSLRTLVEFVQEAEGLRWIHLPEVIIGGQPIDCCFAVSDMQTLKSVNEEFERELYGAKKDSPSQPLPLFQIAKFECAKQVVNCRVQGMLELAPTLTFPPLQITNVSGVADFRQRFLSEHIARSVTQQWLEVVTSLQVAGLSKSSIRKAANMLLESITDETNSPTTRAAEDSDSAPLVSLITSVVELGRYLRG